MRSPALGPAGGFGWPVVVAAAVAVVLTAPVRAEPDLETTERQIAALLDEINDLDVWLGGAGRKLARWQKEVLEHDREIASINTRVRALDKELGATKRALGKLEAERRELLALRRSQAERVAKHLRDAHRLSGQDFFRVMLNLEDPATFDRMIRYHGYFSQARLDALRAYRRTLAAVEDNEAATTRRQQTLAEQQIELGRREQRLADERQKRKALISELNSEMVDQKAKRNRLTADRERLEKLLVELKRRAAERESTKIAANKGKLGWPVDGKLTNRFGQPRAGGRMRWQGLYFTAPTGTDVNAIHSGRVVFADWLRGFGLLTIIDHGDEHMSLYGHADVLYKQLGDWVESGEPIAAAGSSGGQDQSGLYFEVRHHGKPTDPLAWLGSRGG